MTEEDDIVRLDGIPLLREYVWRSLWLTNLRLAAIGLLGGAVLGVGSYYLKFRNGDFTMPVIVGSVMALAALPRIVHWTRHFLAILRQLSDIEDRVRRGEIIHASELEFRSYR